MYSFASQFTAWSNDALDSKSAMCHASHTEPLSSSEAQNTLTTTTKSREIPFGVLILLPNIKDLITPLSPQTCINQSKQTLSPGDYNLPHQSPKKLNSAYTTPA